MTGQVTKILSNSYRVTSDGIDYKGIARGKLKLTGDIFVGDKVEFSLSRDFAVIEKVLPRKTVLIRPYVANVDTVLIVVAPIPTPDYLLVDKIIVNAFSVGVKPILVYNKSDIEPLSASISAVYGEILPVVRVSAATKEGIGELISLLKGRTAAFAGQSAVGKTSLLNALFEASGMDRGTEQVGELSAKSKRGKNTTRHVEMFDFGSFKLADTCGFNVLECEQNDERELAYFYDDYVRLSENCRFRGCSHVSEPDCAVKKAVEEGKSDKGRYERYLLLYEELKKKRGEKYD